MCCGGELDQFSASEPFTERRIVTLATQLLTRLAYSRDFELVSAYPLFNYRKN